jgi:hypothetical protein
MALICTVVGYALWYLVIKETDVNVAGLTVFVQPVAGLALSVVFLGEPLHAGQFWGSAIILAGLIVGLRSPAPLHRAGWWREQWMHRRTRLIPVAAASPRAPAAARKEPAASPNSKTASL